MKMKRIVVFLLAVLLFPIEAVAAKECDICRLLSEKGFPTDYLEPLCALTLSHPTWNFEPLFITELSRKQGKEYDFSYVVAAETVSGRSLVTGAEGFDAYYHREAMFDTGYYNATRDAVAYFVDPRNFLSEKGVFQFLNVSSNSVSAEGIEDLLRGSAPSKAENITEILVRVGEKTGLDPLFLASRLRQEQGSDGSPLLWGTAGSVLSRWYDSGVDSENGKWVASPRSGYDGAKLKALDGFFNPLHAETSGQGAFEVYYNGAMHAKSQGWNTLEKGLLGGAEKIRREYMDAYQNTLYLQKWNVDIRSVADNGGSRNFWGQYMQNIGGAKTEGDRLFETFKDSGRLESNLNFSIPVYEGMGEKNPDPAGGACSAFAADEIPNSPHLYLHEVLSPAASSLATTQKSEEKEEKEQKKRDPFLMAASFAFLGVGFLVWGLANVKKRKK